MRHLLAIAMGMMILLAGGSCPAQTPPKEPAASGAAPEQKGFVQGTLDRLKKAFPPSSEKSGNATAPASAKPKPFLSTCIVQPPLEDGCCPIVRPTKQVIDEPYYDEPFAVHVPLEVPYQDGNVTIYFVVNVVWDNAPFSWTWQLVGSKHPKSEIQDVVADYGLYRADGMDLDSWTVIDGGGDKAVMDKAGPVPSYVERHRGSMVAPCYVYSESEKHQPFAIRPYNRGFNALRLSPVKPGWYVLWVGFPKNRSGFQYGLGYHCDPEFDISIVKDGRVTGRLYTDFVIFRGPHSSDNYPHPELFDKKRAAQRGRDAELVRTLSIETPITLRRNGWIFDRAEVTPMSEETKTAQYSYDNGLDKQSYIINSSVNVSGARVQLNLSSTSWSGHYSGRGNSERNELRPDGRRGPPEPSKPIYREQNTWDIRLPARIDDHVKTEVLVAGSKTWEFFDKRYRGRDRFFEPETPPPGWKENDLWYFSRFSPDWIVKRTFLQSGEDTDRRYEKASRDLVKDYTEEESRHRSLVERRGPDKKDAPLRIPCWSSIGEIALANRQSTNKTHLLYHIVSSRHPPLWQVDAYYRRLSADRNFSAAPSLDAETKVVEDKDPYWKWYPSLSRLIGEQMKVVDLAYVDASHEAEPLQELLRSVQRLSQDLGGRTAIESVFASSAEPAQLTDAAFNRKVARVKQTRDEIRQRREQIDLLTQQARAALQKILDKYDEGLAKFGDSHFELLAQKRAYREKFERVPIDIALQSKDREALRKALAAADNETSSAKARVYEAELHLAEGDMVAGLYALRSAVAIDPGDMVAQKKLEDIECAFLKSAIDKSQGAIHDARTAFYSYLLERGFTNCDIHVTGEFPFARAVSWSTQAVKVYGEEAWAMFTTGLFGSFSAFYGKPVTQEMLLATTERQMTTAFIGLNSILRLRKKGYSFEKIAKMTSVEVRDALKLRDWQGSYSNQQAALHCVAIREAMQLPDIKALVTDDRMGLQLGLQKAYWNNRDVGDTWVEWIGDATSMYNLLLALPGAKVVKYGPSKLIWTQDYIAMTEDLAKMNKVISGTEAVANTIGLTRMLNAAGATASGQRLLKHLAKVEKYQEGLNWYDTVIWTTGKITGMIGLNVLTYVGAEQLAGPKAAMLLQIALMFGYDYDTLLKLLKSRNIPPEKVAALVINEYLPATQLHLKRLAQMEKSASELRTLFERLKRGHRLSADDLVFLNKYFEKDWRKLIPNGKASHDARIAMGASAEGVGNGINNGADNAVRELQPDLQQEARATAESAEDARRLADGLNQNAASARGPPGSLKTAPGSLKRFEVEEIKVSDIFDRRGFPLPPRPAPDSACARAKALLDAGKFREAEDEYERIINRILKGELFLEDEKLPLDWIHMDRCLAYQLQRLKHVNGHRPPPGLHSLKYCKPPSAATVDQILANPSKWRAKPSTGVMGAMFEVEGESDCLIKVIYRNNTEITVAGERKLIQGVDVLADIENNRVHVEMAQACGIATPGMDVRLVHGADGAVEKAIYVMRKVQGVPLNEKKAGEIFLYREDLARHRAVALSLGDYDRKLDNYIVAEDGRLFAIDAGVADVRGGRLNGLLGEYSDDKIYSHLMSGPFGRDHHLSRFYKDEIGAIALRRDPTKTEKVKLLDPKSNNARNHLIAEQSLTYQAAKPTVDELLRLAKPENEKELIEMFTRCYQGLYASESEINHLMERFIRNKRAGGEVIDLAQDGVKDQIRRHVLSVLVITIKTKVNESVSAFRHRTGWLDKCMQGLNERNAIPLPGSGGTSRIELYPSVIENIVWLHFINTIGLRRAA